MQVFHTPKNTNGNVTAAAIAIHFSADRFNVEVSQAQEFIIDEFFDSLKWDNTGNNVRSPYIYFGDLMMMLNMKDRWAYRGSMTTPPCDWGVYWNVLKSVYPIKQKHLD